MNYSIRLLQTDDSLAVIELLNKLDSETDFSPYMEGERRLNAFQLATNMAMGTQTLFGAESFGKLVGYIVLSRELASRLQHNCVIGLGVLESHQRQGIGHALMLRGEEWARQQSILRMELTVTTSNERAVQLYGKLAYTIEGTKKASFLLNGNYYDEYIMAKWLD